MATRYINIVFFALFVNIACASFCDKVREKYSPKDRYISQYDKPKNITLYWDGDPARAAASQLLVVLRYVFGYQFIHLQQTPSNIPAERPCEKSGLFEEVRISMTSPMLQRLHVRLARHFQHKAECVNITKWSSYNDAALLSKCGFEDLTNRSCPVVELIQLNINNRKMSDAIVRDLKTSSVPFKINESNRADLYHKLRTSNKSILFIDYDWWADERDIRTIVLPSYLNTQNYSKRQTQRNIITTVSDSCLLEEFASYLLKIVNKYVPSLNSLRAILETESHSKDLDETVCKQIVTKNYNEINILMKKAKPRKKTYKILSIICEDDPDLKKYDKLLFTLGFNRYKNRNSKFYIFANSLYLNCSDASSVINDVHSYMLNEITPSLIGIVVGAVKYIDDIANVVNFHNIPVLLYDATAVDNVTIKVIKDIAVDDDMIDSRSSVWVSTGRSLHLTLALQYFMLNMGWTRLAVLSDQTRTANGFMKDLTYLGGLVLGDYQVKHTLTHTEAVQLLEDIIGENGRIIFVNTDYENAVTILETAVRLKMDLGDKYVWILREWQANTPIMNVRHFVISFSCRHRSNNVNTMGGLDYDKILNELWPDNPMWPPQAAAFVDAILTVIEGFDSVIGKYAQAQDDPQSKEVMQRFEKSLIEEPVKGICHTLKYENRTLEQVAVFVDEWRGRDSRLLMQMRVNITSQQVTIDYEGHRGYYLKYSTDDGSKFCITKAGDPYNPTCNDILWVAVVIVVMLPLFAILLLQNYVRRRKEIV